MTSSVSNEYALLPNMNVQVKLERQEAICTMTFDGVIWQQLPECFASILMLEDTGKAFW